jgi:hypothetical protein
MATKNDNTAITPANEFPAELAELLNNIDSAVTADQLEAMAAALAIDDTAAISPWRIADKAELVNRPFYVRSWKFAESDQFIGDFVILYLVTYDSDEMLIITDGSTGLCEQVRKIQTERREKFGPDAPVGFLKAANGLRVSEYMVDASGKPTKNRDEKVSTAKTYYFG